jgi:hypothetical protein
VRSRASNTLLESAEYAVTRKDSCLAKKSSQGTATVAINNMDRQVRAVDTVLVKSRERTDWSQTVPLWLSGDGLKTTENKIHWPRWL